MSFFLPFLIIFSENKRRVKNRRKKNLSKIRKDAIGEKENRKHISSNEHSSTFAIQ